MDTNSTTETTSPPTTRRWWRPQFTIVQMLLAFMIVAMCAANWLLRRDIEKVRQENRFYREFVEFDLTQIGSCSVKEKVRDLNLADQPNLKAKDYEITLVLNPQKNYKLCSNYGKLNSFDIKNASTDIIYTSKSNEYVVVQFTIEELFDEVIFSNPKFKNTYINSGSSIKFSLYESSTFSINEQYFTELIVNHAQMQYLATVKHLPIQAGVHDLSKPLSLLSITDSTDEPENSQGLQIWLQEE